MGNTIFLVDGFNLYHSLHEAEQYLAGRSTKWLDLVALCNSYLFLVGQRLGTKATFSSIDYFSAKPSHRGPDSVARHSLYLRALQDSGVRVHLGRFKRKPRRCPSCQYRSNQYEEKETDVAIACRLVELACQGTADAVVVVSGDTDLAPAVRTANRLAPGLLVLFAFPYRRKNKELAQLCPGSFSMDAQVYGVNQLADPLALSNGTVLHKPTTW